MGGGLRGGETGNPYERLIVPAGAEPNTSIRLFIYLSFFRSLSLSLSLSIYIHLRLYLSVYLFIYRSIYLHPLSVIDGLLRFHVM